MPQIKEGFKGQRIFSLPEQTINKFVACSLVSSLYISKIGYFPQVKYHYNNKSQGVPYNILIHCVSGKGWFEMCGVRHILSANMYVILPAGVPYSFGADENNPWTIYWVHFGGKAARDLLGSSFAYGETPTTESSRTQYRIDLFEEIFMNMEMGYIREYYLYACSVFMLYLNSFLLQNPFQLVTSIRNTGFIDRVYNYMNENISSSPTVNDIASYFGYSVSHFSMKFRTETGYSPMDYFIKLKIRKACHYLELTDMRPSQIYSKLGFNDAAYFTRIFTKIMGISPTAYRKKERQ